MNLAYFAFTKYIKRDIQLSEIGNALKLTETGALDILLGNRDLRSFSELYPFASALRLNQKEFLYLLKLYNANLRRNYKHEMRKKLIMPKPLIWKFIGEDGSMGLKKYHTYNIRTRFCTVPINGLMKQCVIVFVNDGIIHIPYESIISMLKNWQVENN